MGRAGYCQLQRKARLMDATSVGLLAVVLFVAALLYTSVGHAGASGYLAAMAIFGLSQEAMKPTALVLNVLVATLATVKFCRAGCFAWCLFWPFALTSVPLAFIGGAVTLPETCYKPLVGLTLLVAAARLLAFSDGTPADSVRHPPLPAALAAGAGIGFLSGLTGVGAASSLAPCCCSPDGPRPAKLRACPPRSSS